MIFFRTVVVPFEWLRLRAGVGLARLGVSPNVITLLGLPVYATAGLLFACKQFSLAAIVLCFAGLTDVLDGAVARVSGRVTRFGAFLDSTVDRYCDAAVFGGIIYYYLSEGEPLQVCLGISALVGSLAISYARARAECFISSCRVGFFERPERLVILVLGALFHHMLIALWILGTLTHWTVLARVAYTRRMLSARPAPKTNTFFGQLYHILLWDFNRGSLQYDLLAIVLLAVCVWG